MEEIEGELVEFEFLILREGWEMDNKGWVTMTGRVYTTSHGGGAYEMSMNDLEEHIALTQYSLAGLQYARTMMKTREKDEET